ncbi:serine hydrolase domain-containing protein [Vagococcus sp.]|uniref:serine hydrolase domain-containing protein n=1 Tax=Vagococcus sp. TaxID=1933889 RepID=UPI003F997A08
MIEKMDEMIQELINQNIFPGAIYAFIDQKNVVKRKQGLKQRIPNRQPLTFETLFDMASLTKVIATNTILLKLIEQNELEIDLPVAYYLPEFKDRLVTIRHLLTHTSAINPYIENRDRLNQLELKASLLKLKSSEERGQTFKYTDTGTILLGFMIERLYGDDFANVVTKEVLVPLKMKNSFFVKAPPTRTAPTELHPKRGLICGEVHDPKAYVLKEHCGSAGLFSTLDDTLKFTEMMLNRGKLPNGQPFLKETTLLNLLQDQTPMKNLKRSLGWDLIKKDKDYLLFHTGYTGTFMILNLLNQTAFLFLSNRVHPEDHRELYLKQRSRLIQLYLKIS